MNCAGETLGFDFFKGARRRLPVRWILTALAVVCFLPLVHADALDLSQLPAKLSYGVGVDIGQAIQGRKVRLAALLRGMQDVLEDRVPLKELPDAADKDAYARGCKYAENMKKAGTAVDFAALKAGIEDALTGTPRLTQDEIFRARAANAGTALPQQQN